MINKRTMTIDSFHGSNSVIHHNDEKASLDSLLPTGNTLHPSDE